MRTRPDNEVFDKVWYLNRTETWIAEMIEERNKIWNDPLSDREIYPSFDEDEGNLSRRKRFSSNSELRNDKVQNSGGNPAI